MRKSLSLGRKWTTPNLGYFVLSCLREGESNPPPALSLTEPCPAVYRPSGILTFPLANSSGCSVTGTSAADSEDSLSTQTALCVFIRAQAAEMKSSVGCGAN